VVDFKASTIVASWHLALDDDMVDRFGLRLVDTVALLLLRFFLAVTGARRSVPAARLASVRPVIRHLTGVLLAHFLQLAADMDDVVLHLLAFELGQALAAVFRHEYERASLHQVGASHLDVVLRE
jgi:hypothetical protein